MATPLIEFKQVTKRFEGRAVLDRIDLSIFEGEVTTIIGKSGVGKSVLLKHFIGLFAPDEGQVWLHGQPIHGLPRKEKNSRLGGISYMFQNNALFDALTVYENIALPLQHTTRMDKAQIHTKVMERITQTELTDVSQRYPAELSGGMQKRTALARALVTDPEIVLFDEPTTGQDPIRRNAILGMIAEYQRRLGFTAVLISHDLPDVLFISNRVFVLYDGKIIFQGPAHAFDAFDHPFRNEFIHSLESLQEELTGLYSRRHFKVRYQNELRANPRFESYAVVVFSLENMAAIQAGLGHPAAQELISAIGMRISRHFRDAGGFTTRHGLYDYTTMLPYSDIEEAAALAQGFADEFSHTGLCELLVITEAGNTCRNAVPVSLMAAIAQGKPDMDIESTIAEAASNQKKILEFSARCKGKES